MNKSELIDALTERLGDKKAAGAAVEAVVDTIIRAVSKGEKVAIAGFGVFEKQVRNARMARNPATGAPVRIKKTAVPKFRPGAGFKEVVSGAKKLTPPAKSTVKAVPAKATRTTAKAAPAKAARSLATKSPAKRATRAPATKTAAAKKLASKSASAPAKTSAAKKLASKAPAKRAAVKAASVRKAATKAPATKSAAAKKLASKSASAPAKTSAAKKLASKAPAKRA